MGTEKSISEKEIEKLLEECETIVDNSYLTTNDARRILTAGQKILTKCEELRKSRDKWKLKYEDLKNGR